MNDAAIKDNIRKLRKKRNMTQEELANKLGISTKAYQDLETGPTMILSGKLTAIAAALNTSPEILLLGYLPDAESHRLEQIEAQYEEKYLNLQQECEHWKHLAEERGRLLEEKDARLRDKDTIINLLQNK